MKEIHFYIQGLMILLALACAVQFPLDGSLIVYAVMVQIVLGIYQYLMSWFLIRRLRRPSLLLNIYFFSVHSYFVFLVCLSLLTISESQWMYLVYGVPWVFAVYFLVVTESLLWRK